MRLRPASNNYMQDHKCRERFEQKPIHGEFLDHLLWQGLGFEEQFGVTFFQDQLEHDKSKPESGSEESSITRPDDQDP